MHFFHHKREIRLFSYHLILQHNSTSCFHNRETEFGTCLQEVQRASSFDFKDRFLFCRYTFKNFSALKFIHQNHCKARRQRYNQFEMLCYHDFEHFGDSSLVNLARGKFYCILICCQV